MKTYKGDLLGAGVDLVYAFIFIGILLGAGVVALVSFNSTLSNTSQAYFAINNATSGLLNVSLQMPTVGTIGGIGLIIIVLFTALGGTYMYLKK